MSEDEIKALRATMPWSERVFRTPQGGLVQIVSNQGQEVPLFTMTAFLLAITAKMARQPEGTAV